VVLALIDAAWTHAPTAPAAWLRGYCMRAASESVADLTAREQAVLAKRPPRVDPRVEPGGPPMSGVAVGRVEVVRRPG
jgi:hypothetical protein